MSKIILNDISNLQNEGSVVTAFNNNNATIETAFENTLSRDGSSPNQMEADLDMNFNRILNLPSPSSNGDPIRLVDFNNLVEELTGAQISPITENTVIKAPCRVATTTNIALSGLQTIDGVSVAAFDRVLVKDQTDARENGIYEASSGAWQRTPDFDGPFDVVEGTRVLIKQGTLHANTEFIVVSSDPITIGVSDILFDDFMSPTLAAAVENIVFREFPDKATAEASSALPSTVKTVILQGRFEPGDSPRAPYVSRLSEPAHAGKVQIGGVWYELESHDGVHITHFGAKNGRQSDGSFTNAFDCAQPLVDAIDYCVQKRRDVIRIPSGVWAFSSGGITIPVGLHIIGDGMSSSFGHGGTTLIANFDMVNSSDFFLQFDGSGQSANSTGGGISKMAIWRYDTRHKGTCIAFNYINSGNRPGWTLLKELIITGYGSAPTGGTWDVDIAVNGGGLNQPGGQGIRDLSMENLWLFAADITTLALTNATHLDIRGMYVAQATGSATPTVHIGGVSDQSTERSRNVRVSNLLIDGDLIINYADTLVVNARATRLLLNKNVVIDSILNINAGQYLDMGLTALTPQDIINLRNNNVFLNGANPHQQRFGSGTTNGSGVMNVTFSPAFANQCDHVDVTVIGTGQFSYGIASKSNTGFSGTLYNGVSPAASQPFTYHAWGY